MKQWKTLEFGCIVDFGREFRRKQTRRMSLYGGVRRGAFLFFFFSFPCMGTLDRCLITGNVRR
jgi:hypothetical protein